MLHKAQLQMIAAAVFFNVWLPKAGVKVGELPITLGNLLLGLTIVLGLTAFFAGHRIRSTPLIPILFITMTYFSIRLFAAAGVGISVIDYLVPLVVYPLMYIALTAVLKDRSETERISKILVGGFYCICAYATLQTVLGIGSIDVPGLTVNLSDYLESEQWYLEKSNQVDDWIKAPSTYQNGNLFGVALLIMFPLVFHRSRGGWRALALAAFTLSILLSLSRSAWVGLALYFFVQFVLTGVRSLTGLLLRLIGFASAVAAVMFAFVQFPQLGERLGQADSLESIFNAAGRTPLALEMFDSIDGSLIAYVFGPQGIVEFSGDAYEMTYFAVFKAAGVIGVLLFVAVLIVAGRHPSVRASEAGDAPELLRTLRITLFVYGTTAIIEGGYWLPPTALLLWVVVGVIHASLLNISAGQNYSLTTLSQRQIAAAPAA